jgi:hypothetical protein
MWQKYKIGEALKILDPEGGQESVSASEARRASGRRYGG